MIGLPIVSSGSYNFIVGAERAENRVERSVAVSGRCRKTMDRGAGGRGRKRLTRSAEWEVAERERSVERGLQK